MYRKKQCIEASELFAILGSTKGLGRCLCGEGGTPVFLLECRVVFKYSKTDKTWHLLNNMDSQATGLEQGSRGFPEGLCVSLQLLDNSGARGLLGEGWRGGRASGGAQGSNYLAVYLPIYQLCTEGSLYFNNCILYSIILVPGTGCNSEVSGEKRESGLDNIAI